MDIFKRIIRFMVLVILAPFKFINYICYKAKSSDMPKSVITVICEFISVMLALKKIRPFSTGRWILAIILFVFYLYVLLGITLTIFTLIIAAFDNLTCKFAEMFDDTYCLLAEMPVLTFSDIFDLNNIFKNKKIKKKCKVNNKSDKSKIDLSYFIDMDIENNRIPILKYISEI